MRENQFLGILALVFALGMPLTFELFACILAAEGKIFDAAVQTEDELFAAITDPSITHITFQNDIIIMRNLNLSRNLILDLNGFNLTSITPDVCVVDIKYGNIILTGQGSIVAYGSGGTAVRIRGATTHDNEDYAAIFVDTTVKLFAPNHYGLLVAPNFHAAYGVTVDFRGSLVAQDGICLHESIRGSGKNAPFIKIADQAKITVDENSGVAVYATGCGRWEIGAAELSGATGIIAQSGEIALNGTQIIATGEFVETRPKDDRLTMIGAVLQSGKALRTDQATKVTINGGTYTSLRSYLFVETRPKRSRPALRSLVIDDGDFAGKRGTFYGLAPRHVKNAVTVVYGGNFTENVQEYISSSCHVDKFRGQGIYHVIADQAAAELDAATQLRRAENQLQTLIATATTYVADHTVGDIGKWRPNAVKALAAIKRAITLSKKTLKTHPDYERIVAAEHSLRQAIDNFELIGDALRTTLAESIASVEAIDAQDYTAYSYEQLTIVATAAAELLQTDDVPLEDLYSATLDIEINIDLLDSTDENSVEELDALLVASNSVLSSEPTSSPSDDLIEQDPPTKSPALSPADCHLIELFASLLLTQTTKLLTSPVTTTILDAPTAAPTTTPGTTPETTTPAPELDATYILAHSVEYPAEAALLEAKGNLYSMLEAVQDLTLEDYQVDFAEQFGELQVAIVKARTILYKPNTNFVELMSAMDELTTKTIGLKCSDPTAETETTAESETTAETAPAISENAAANEQINTTQAPAPTTLEKAVQVDWTALAEVVAEISYLNPDDYTATSYNAVLAQLETAKSLLADPQATPAAAEDLVFDINLALLALEPAPLESTNIATVDPEPAAVYASSPIPAPDPTVTPNWLMSMLAGAYAGLATYRRSRLTAKQQKHSAI